MDSEKLAELVDFGTRHGFDSVLVVRHGKIVAEAYYAPYVASIPHTVNSCTKSVIGTLVAIAFKDGLLDSTNHRALDFFDRTGIANLDNRKEAITVQNLLDMTSGLEWEEPYGTASSVTGMVRSPDWVKFILDRPMSGTPGETFHYNSGNAHLLSAILTIANKILDVATEKASEVGPTSKIAADVSGKVYRFAPNQVNLKSFSLILNDPQPHYDIEIYNRETTKSWSGFTGPIGLDGLYRKGELIYHGFEARDEGAPRVNAVKGAWRDDHTFVIDCLALGDGNLAEQWTLTFNGDKLDLRVKLAGELEISIDGETGG